MEKIILASKSSRRRSWLQERVGALDVELSSFSLSTPEPEPINGLEVGFQTEQICLHKIKAVLREIIERGDVDDRTLVVVSDTLVEDPDDIMIPLGKPSDPLLAASMLIRLSGRRHRVWSSSGIIYPFFENGMIRFQGGRGARIWTDCSIVEFSIIDEGKLEELVGSESWLGKSGGYDLAGEAAEIAKLVEGEEITVLGFSPRAIEEVISRVSNSKQT